MAVEVAPCWRTSSYTDNDNCVEVAALGTAVGVRDSKVADSAVITINPASWACLIARAGR
ncbi:DUF397 domain-containing protein [Embleya sp. NBC_00896]|uniref:DUF397 domain-containing protein n=1 Tax=Embleya sp. NBC_00896 TaxID=2975961 RepID=UPI0038663B20|nr:DUF397 domain-containing protein [Embleya sp. NBC_00896]